MSVSMNSDPNSDCQAAPLPNDEGVEALTTDEKNEISAKEQRDDTDQETEEPLIAATNLSSVPFSEWQAVWVSKRSRLMEVVWDFQEEVAYLGSFRYTFDKELPDGSLLTDKKNEELTLFFKAIVHYCLPHNDVIGRHRTESYVSSVRSAGICFHIVCWLFRIGVFSNEPSGTRRSARSISQAELDRFVTQLPVEHSFSQSERIVYMLENWYDLSRAAMLPVEFSLTVSARKGRSILEIYPGYEQSIGWQPIAADVLYPLITGSLKFLEERADDILSVVKVWAAGRARGKLTNKRVSSLRTAVRQWAEDEADGRFKDHDGRRWLDVPRITGNYPVAWVYEIARALSAACWVLIIFPMGFRRSEIGELTVGCTRVVNEKTGECRIKATIFKTSQGSRGDPVDLPCPPITHLAVTVMEKLTSFSRAPGETKLFTSLRHGRQRWVGNLTDDIILLCNMLGIQDVPHSHQFRKTIASFFVYQNPQNIYLLKRLFTHSSLRMTMKYVTSIATIAREIREYISTNNRTLLKELFQSAGEGRIGGHGGKRIGRVVRERFRGLSQEDVMESADSYVEALLESGVAMLHRTPLCICTKTPSLTQRAPCDPANPTVQSRLHPRVDKCIPWDCSFAAFIPANEAAVRVDVDFHLRLLSRPSVAEAQRKISQRIVKRGKEILSELSSEGRPLSEAS